MPATIAIIGAGSVVFTRDLLGDVFSFPELSDARVVLHDIDPERLDTAVAIAEATAARSGPTRRSRPRPSGARRSTAPTT